MAFFMIAGVRVEVIRTEGADRALEFRVMDGDQAAATFAVFRGFDEEWESARLIIDPQADGVALSIILWAIEYSQAHL